MTEPRPTPRPGGTRPDGPPAARRPTPRPPRPSDRPRAPQGPPTPTGDGASRRGRTSGAAASARPPRSSSSGRPSGPRAHRPTPRELAEAANRRRAAAILGIGCVIILVVVGGLLHLWAAAVAGCLGWVVVMVVSARNDRAGGRR